MRCQKKTAKNGQKRSKPDFFSTFSRLLRTMNVVLSKCVTFLCQKRRATTFVLFFCAAFSPPFDNAQRHRTKKATLLQQAIWFSFLRRLPLPTHFFNWFLPLSLCNQRCKNTRPIWRRWVLSELTPRSHWKNSSAT